MPAPSQGSCSKAVSFPIKWCSLRGYEKPLQKPKSPQARHPGEAWHTPVPAWQEAAHHHPWDKW